MTVSAATLRPKKRERTRDALLVAAQEILLDGGAAALTVREVTARAEVSHGTFYNHFESIERLVDGVALLVQMAHVGLVEEVARGVEHADELFAVTTRQSLRAFGAKAGLGRLLFDAGLAVDRFAEGLREHLRGDLRRGVREGRFRVDDFDLALALVAGGVLGLALDLHRGRLAEGAIEPAVVQLLVVLGVPKARAKKLGHEPRAFVQVPSLPLRFVGVRS